MMPFWCACYTASHTERKQVEALPRAQRVPVAVLRDRNAGDVLHDEVRPPVGGGAGVEHPGDIGVIHQGERLALGLEAGDDLLRVHAGLDHLHRNAAPERLGLLRQVHRAHAALPEQLDDVIRPDLRRQRRAGRAMADVGTGGGLGLGVVEAGRSVMIHASL
jgi:hypothetical protein